MRNCMSIVLRMKEKVITYRVCLNIWECRHKPDTHMPRSVCGCLLVCVQTQGLLELYSDMEMNMISVLAGDDQFFFKANMKLCLALKNETEIITVLRYLVHTFPFSQMNLAALILFKVWQTSVFIFTLTWPSYTSPGSVCKHIGNKVQ